MNELINYRIIYEINESLMKIMDFFVKQFIIFVNILLKIIVLDVDLNV